MNINIIRKNEILRYVIVGGGAVTIDFIVYFFLIQILNIDSSWSKRISFVCGGIWSFFANKFFTFRTYEFKVKEPIYFVIVYAFGFLLNTLIHDLILKILTIKLVAFGIATFISVVWNYIGQKWIVFKKK